MARRRYSLQGAATAFCLAALCLAAWAAPVRAEGLRLLAGAGLRQPVDRLIEAFTRRTGVKVYVDYGGSGQIMTRLLISRQGDVFMPGAMFYTDRLKEKGLVASVRPIVLHTPVTAVNRAKAGLVHGLEDLARPGLRVGLGDPKAMALGRIAAGILRRAGLSQKVAPNVVVRTATVKQLALYVSRGFVDAAIIARSDAFMYRDRVVMRAIPQKYYTPDVIGAAVLRTASDPAAAARLQNFLSSPRGQKAFQDFGFSPLPGPGR